MYEVSNDYRVAMKRPVQRFKIQGTVGNRQFTESNILKGSLSITNQFSNGDDILLGSVYVGELRCTFLRGFEIAEKEEITISEALHISGVNWEYVPLGIFKISEANKTASGIEVVAHDRMILFDKRLSLNTSSGTPYELLTLACNTCGVQLAQTQSEIEQLPNGSEFFGIYTESDMETWRDFVFWIAQTLSCFATITRDGKLILRPLRNTESVDDTIDKSHRLTGASFSQFETRYSGISVVNISDATTSYYGHEPDNYLTYNLGSNPLLQFGTDNIKERQRRAVLNGLLNVGYAPFTAQVLGGAAYDLGDIIEFTEGIAGTQKYGCVMRIDYHYGLPCTLEGVGKNPDLANARSKVDKDISGLMNNLSTESIQYYTYINAQAYTIGDEETLKIIDIRFASLKSVTVIFQAEILLDADTNEYDDVVAKVRYRVNESEVLNYNPTETWVDGKHVLHLLYVLDIEGTLLNHFEALLNINGGSVDIGQGDIRAVIYGQGLAAETSWDGLITITDTIRTITLGNDMQIRSIEDDVTAQLQNPVMNNMTDDITVINLSGMRIRTIDDTLYVGRTSLYQDGMLWADVYAEIWGAIYDEHTW